MDGCIIHAMCNPGKLVKRREGAGGGVMEWSQDGLREVGTRTRLRCSLTAFLCAVSNMFGPCVVCVLLKMLLAGKRCRS